MDYRDAVEQLSPEVVQGLRRAVETGRWPDGRPLTPEQRRHSLQAVIAWEALHLPDEARVGFIDRGAKACGTAADDAVAPLAWRDPVAGESP